MKTLQNSMLKKGKKGFTLTELAIVIAVIAILIAVLVPTFTSVITSAKETAAQEDATNAITAYNLEQIDSGSYEVLADGSIVKSGDYCFVYIGGDTYLEEDLSDTQKTTYSAQFNAVEAGSGLAAAGLTAYVWDYYKDTFNDDVTIYMYSESTAAATAAITTAITTAITSPSDGDVYYTKATLSGSVSYIKLTYTSSTVGWTAETSTSAAYTTAVGTSTATEVSSISGYTGYTVNYIKASS